jgi:hypothetical protein
MTVLKRRVGDPFGHIACVSATIGDRYWYVASTQVFVILRWNYPFNPVR